MFIFTALTSSYQAFTRATPATATTSGVLPQAPSNSNTLNSLQAVLDWAPNEMSILAVWSHGWFRFLTKPRAETSEGWAMDALVNDSRVSNLRIAPAAIGAELGTLTPVIGKRA